MKDFIYRLTDHIKRLNLDAYPIKVGILSDRQCLTVRPVTGSEVIHQYMDSMMDIRLPFEVIIKSFDQEEAYNTLSNVMNHVQELVIPEVDEGLVLLKLDVLQLPAFDKFEDGYYYYVIKLSFDLTVHN